MGAVAADKKYGILHYRKFGKHFAYESKIISKTIAAFTYFVTFQH